MFFNNYTKPGKGVEKRDPNQPRHQIFAEILPRNIWRLIKLNTLYLLVSLPLFLVTLLVMNVLSTQILGMFAGELLEKSSSNDIVGFNLMINLMLSFWFTVFLGQGPITAGLTYIVREYGNERPCWYISDFFEQIKLNFKQGFLLWILDIVVICSGFLACLYYTATNMHILTIMILCSIIVYILAHIYIYQIMITYKLKLRHIFKNAILISIGKLPRSLLILVCQILVYIVLPILILFYGNDESFLIMLVIEIALLPSLSAFTINFCIYPTLKKICG